MQSIVSVDVEAMPFRAETEHVERLIYGRLSDGEYGIKKLCSIFNEHAVKGVFMVDFAEAKIYGDKVFKKITDDIISSGHEVELHYHSEVHFNNKKKFFKNLSLDEAKEALEFGCNIFQKITGRNPTAFRAGGFLINRETLNAASSCGITVSTNIVPKFKIHSDVLTLPEGTDLQDIFKWSNGIMEMCVDVPVPELSNSSMYPNDNSGLQYINDALKRKGEDSLFNIVLHSWSLLKRGLNGYHEEYIPEYEINLHRLLDLLSNNTTSTTYRAVAEKIQLKDNFPKIELSYLSSYSSQNVEAIKMDNQFTINNIDVLNTNFTSQLNLSGPCELEITSEIFGGHSLKENSLLISFRFDKEISNYDNLGLSKSDRNDIDLYKYLNTGPGLVTGTFSIHIPAETILLSIDVIKWYANDSAIIRKITLKKIEIAQRNNTDQPSPIRHLYSYVANRIPATEKKLNIQSFQYHLPVLQKLYDLSGCDYFGLLTIENFNIPFISSEREVRILWARRQISSSIINQISTCIFNELPSVNQILIDKVFLEDYGIDSLGITEPSSSTFVLQLPSDFKKYVSSISKSLTYDIRRESKRLSEQYPALEFQFYPHSKITASLLNKVGTLIKNHLLFKRSTDETKKLEWDPLASFILNVDNYKKNGLIAVMCTGNDALAAAVLLIDGDVAHLIAAGNLDGVTKYSLGKILTFNLVEWLINKGINKLIMGGGDFGYKTRFGAKLLYLHDIKIPRGYIASDSYVPCSISLSKSVNYTDHYLETAIGLDLNRMVERDDLGFPTAFNRYQSTTDSAFKKLLSYIPYNPKHTFLDVGSGKGKVLIYASLLGYKKLIGLEYSKELQDIAISNLQKIDLTSDIKLITCDASCIDPDLFNEVDVIFLYNPFGKDVLKGFLHQLNSSLISHPMKGVYLIYLNDVHRELFIDFPCSKIKRFENGVSGHAFDSASIFYCSYQATKT